MAKPDLRKAYHGARNGEGLSRAPPCSRELQLFFCIHLFEGFEGRLHKRHGFQSEIGWYLIAVQRKGFRQFVPAIMNFADIVPFPAFITYMLYLFQNIIVRNVLGNSSYVDHIGGYFLSQCSQSDVMLAYVFQHTMQALTISQLTADLEME
jgi:hypothetical protein